MTISIIGASGGVGRDIAEQLIRNRSLETREILQLVSADSHSSHPHLLHGLRADLLDAFAEIAPDIEVVTDLKNLNGDIIVMTAGHTFAISPDQIGGATRDELALRNRPIFEHCARAITAQKRDEPPLCIIVSNPVELGVQIFSQYLPREGVIGMGAHSDSLRFRAEIAADLGVKRNRVHGFVVGEHGAGLVPLWSSVRVGGLSKGEWLAYQERASLFDFSERLTNETRSMIALLRDDKEAGPLRAFERIAELSPDLRVALKPIATHYTQAKTVVATAHATVDLIEDVLSGATTEVAVQYQHEGENGLHGPFGARVLIAEKVEDVLPLDGCTEEEKRLIEVSNRAINEKLGVWCA